MGTNYYVVKNRPTICSPVHIGKSSLGNRFCFQMQDNNEYDPPISWYGFGDVKTWLIDNVKRSKKHLILDEYDETIPVDTFLDMVDRKQSAPVREGQTVDYQGYRFVRYDFV